ncbi:MAG: CehA/McbA family metallohydrolase [Chloroflexi bacterium]|nr:CehA/McbA family metallohydrolase [Chloroflexota bacterium]
MTFYERVGVLHIHTTYSDGTWHHRDLARLANKMGLDFLVITDHNVYAGEHEGWYGDTLLLVGEELHDPQAAAPENHLLAFGVGEELTLAGADRPCSKAQAFIDAVRERGGLAYLAHPVEHSGDYALEPEINWTAWDASGYDGLEIWNYMSEFKSYLSELGPTLLYSFFPKLAITGPFPETLHRWDALLALRRVYAIGGVDAHGTVYRLGPLRRAVFSYAHLFRALTTHVLLEEPWSGQAAYDAALVYNALRKGRAFVVYEALGQGHGFRFSAQTRNEIYAMGDEFLATGSVRLHIRTPKSAHLRLLLNGYCIAETQGTELIHESRAPGAYRAEAYRYFPFRKRMWIVSNPIFVRTPDRRRVEAAAAIRIGNMDC